MQKHSCILYCNYSLSVPSISLIRPALGQSCKAVGHVGKFQTQRWRKVSWELVVLRDNVANCCIHGLNCCSNKFDIQLLRLSICLSVCLSNYLALNFSVKYFIYPSLYLSICLPTYLSIYLSYLLFSFLIVSNPIYLSI